MLRNEHGADWRSKLPLAADHEAVMKGQHTSISSIPVETQQGYGKMAVESRASDKMSEEQQLKKYEELKEKGNAHVKKVHRVLMDRYRHAH